MRVVKRIINLPIKHLLVHKKLLWGQPRRVYLLFSCLRIVLMGSEGLLHWLEMLSRLCILIHVVDVTCYLNLRLLLLRSSLLLKVLGLSLRLLETLECEHEAGNTIWWLYLVLRRLIDLLVLYHRIILRSLMNRPLNLIRVRLILALHHS